MGIDCNWKKHKFKEKCRIDSDSHNFMLNLKYQDAIAISQNEFIQFSRQMVIDAVPNFKIIYMKKE